MNTLKFKTNVNCSNCLAKVTPVLNQLKEIQNWHIDLSSPQKTLTVESDQISQQTVISALLSVGFIAEAITR